MLPPDLIINIFGLVPCYIFDDDDIQAPCGPYSLKDTRALLPIALVCKLWRSLVFNTPTLWTSLSDATRTLAKYIRGPLQISRLPITCVGAGPLYVGAEVRDLNSQSAMTSAFFEEHGDRIEELHVRLRIEQLNAALPAGEDEEPLHPTISFSPASLRRLSMYGFVRNDGDGWRDRSLFGGSHLNLSSLLMWNIPFFPTNVIRPSLTRLIVYNVSVLRNCEGRGAIPVRNLLRFLSGNVALELVYLHGIAAAQDTDLEPLPVVSMPCLRKLSITFSQSIYQVLSHLRLPDTCLVRLREDRMVSLLYGALESAIAFLGWEGTKAHVVLGVDPERYQDERHRESASLQVINRAAGGLRIDLTGRFLGPIPDLDFSQLIRSLLSTRPFATVEELWLSGWRVAELLSGRRSPISPLSEVTTLHVLNLESFDRAEMLWPNPASGEITMDNLPKLSCLHYRLPHSEHPSEHPSDNKLLALLEARARANHPVSRLFISTRPPSSKRSSTDYDPERGATIIGMLRAFGVEVEVGEDLHDRPEFAWWNVVPHECTAKEGVHMWWPLWVEGGISADSWYLFTSWP
ncbi:hypothetical protein L226DRAFT_535892 [Lentinus tigrinus ALCF2SS1-7]|nr:hypothetical protein L226DRAFT_535892 [Lentinus tigrinus ALCF2SS1-7]